MLYEMSLNARKDFNLIYYLLYRYFYYIIINGIKLYGIILMHFIKNINLCSLCLFHLKILYMYIPKNIKMDYTNDIWQNNHN